MAKRKVALLVLVLAVTATTYVSHADALNVVPRARIGAAGSHSRKFLLESAGDTESTTRPTPHDPIIIPPSPVETLPIDPPAKHQQIVISSLYAGNEDAESDYSPITNPPDFGSPPDFGRPPLATMKFNTQDSTAWDGHMHADYANVKPNPPVDGHDYPPGPPGDMA